LLKQEFGNHVTYGVFKGMKLGDDSWWGLFDQSPMILGTYEKHVQERLKAESNNRRVFIDIGAADGFFGIGAIVSDLFEKAYCFEISQKGQKVIRENARINNISERIEVHGEANRETLLSILSLYKPSEVLILCDIEGAEYDFLDEQLLKELIGVGVIVELHEFIEAGREKAEALIARANEVHQVEELNEIPIDLNEFEVLDSLGSNSRLLAISEGRPEAMRWITLSPKV
jgi:hypothetical protein